jgi:hypothetical protein
VLVFPQVAADRDEIGVMFPSRIQAPAERSAQFVTPATAHIRGQPHERSIQMNIGEMEDSHGT